MSRLRLGMGLELWVDSVLYKQRPEIDEEGEKVLLTEHSDNCFEVM